jgi:phage baseplate assembly protein W
MNIDFPFRLTGDGRSASTDDASHVREMIELLLFTRSGERVMRPDFGTGLLQFVFAGNSPELASALRLTVQAALTQFLGDVIDVRDLRVEANDSELQVTVAYMLRTTGETRTDIFVRSPA